MTKDKTFQEAVCIVAPWEKADTVESEQLGESLLVCSIEERRKGNED